MTWSSFWRSIGKDVEHLATGVSHFANHVVDEGASVVRSLGGDVVKVAHEGSNAVSSVGSSLAMPLAVAAGVAALFLLRPSGRGL